MAEEVDLEETTEISYIQQEGLALIADGEAIAVLDQATFAAAAKFRQAMKGHIARIQEFFKPLKKATETAHKEVVAQEKRYLEGPQAADRLVRERMDAFESAQRVERAKAEAAAAAQAKAITDAAKKDGVALAGPVVIPPKQVELPVADGITYSSTWKVAIVDLPEFLAQLALGTVPLDWVEVTLTPVAQAAARAQKGALKVAGLEVREERTSRVKA